MFFFLHDTIQSERHVLHQTGRSSVREKYSSSRGPPSSPCEVVLAGNMGPVHMAGIFPRFDESYSELLRRLPEDEGLLVEAARTRTEVPAHSRERNRRRALRALPKPH